jgi:hypothetical protein
VFESIHDISLCFVTNGCCFKINVSIKK